MEFQQMMMVNSKYILRSKNEEVEIIAFHQTNDGARTEANPFHHEEGDWVTYIDSTGKEHIREHLNIQLDFKHVNNSTFQNLMDIVKSNKLPNTRNIRIYEVARELFLNKNLSIEASIETAIKFIDNIGIETD